MGRATGGRGCRHLQPPHALHRLDPFVTRRGAGNESVPNRSRSTADGPPAVPSGVHDDWSGVTVCMHVRDVSCTTASMVADLPADPAAPVRIWSTLGSPCTGVFLPVALVGSEAVVPAVLGDPQAWQAFRRLAQAAERPGDEGSASLVAARAALAPIEADAWAEGDQLWSSGAGAAAWRQATARWDASVREVLAGA